MNTCACLPYSSRKCSAVIWNDFFSCSCVRHAADLTKPYETCQFDGAIFELGGFCLRKQPLVFSLPVEEEGGK